MTGRFALIAIFGMIAHIAPAGAQCRKVAEDPVIKIDSAAESQLKSIGIDRAMIFASMVDTSIPETNGCWAAPAGNFDSQIISIGMSQWNYGQGSLQPLLTRYRAKFASRSLFDAELSKLMPTYGSLIFSEGCLRHQITLECRTKILALQDDRHRIDPVLAREYNALFESDPMLQIQTDEFVRMLTSVKSDLVRLFPGKTPSPRQIKWAIDTKVQQGKFPGDNDVKRLRNSIAIAPPNRRDEAFRGLVGWYDGLTASADQDGVTYDKKWNVDMWTCVGKKHAYDDEQFDLLNLTFLRSRTAQGDSGRWQALTFQRRAAIILGVGSVAGRRMGSCTN